MALYLLLFFFFPVVKLAAVDAKWLFQLVLLWDWNCVSSVLYWIGVQFCLSTVSDIIQALHSAISTNNRNISSLKYIKFCNLNIPNYIKLIQLYWNIKRFNLTFWGVLCIIHTFKFKLISGCYWLVILSHSTLGFLVCIFVFCGCLCLWVYECVGLVFLYPVIILGFLHCNIICFMLCVVWQCLDFE